MKISTAGSAQKLNAIKADPLVAATFPFKEVLEQFVVRERAVKASTSAVPAHLKGLMDLQRNSYTLQLQVECASRIADSITSSIKKVQQLGGQG